MTIEWQKTSPSSWRAISGDLDARVTDRTQDEEAAAVVSIFRRTDTVCVVRVPNLKEAKRIAELKLRDLGGEP